MTKTISIRGEVKFKLIIYAMAVKSRRRFAIWCDFAVPAQRQSSPCNEENNLKEARWYVARPYLRGRALMLLESLLFSPNFIYRQMNKIFSPRQWNSSACHFTQHVPKRMTTWTRSACRSRKAEHTLRVRKVCLFLFSSQLLLRGEKCKISQQNVSIGG